MFGKKWSMVNGQMGKKINNEDRQHAYLYVFDHPYAEVTDASGKFVIVIKDIPRGPIL